MIPLEDQDPKLWHWDEARQGIDALHRARAMGRPGPYQVQAAISAVHVESSQRGAPSDRTRR